MEGLCPLDPNRVKARKQKHVLSELISELTGGCDGVVIYIHGNLVKSGQIPMVRKSMIGPRRESWISNF